ncbi:Glyceraldehyde 3-phosphate phosphatase [uncultured archaeon]|nr:Glyceraldehyde 3-phosphate phosphatase [uncultured archaeon]
MPQISVKCILWDYGNTLLLDPFPKILEKIASDCVARLKDYGYDISEKDFISEWSEANRKINYPHISHFVQEEPIIAKALGKLKILPQDMLVILPKILGIYRSRFKEHVRNEARNKEVREIVSWIKQEGFTQGVFSNGRVLDPKPALALMGIEKYFDIIYASEEGGIEKPNPKVFGRILNALKVKPKDCTYIGDDPLRDVECAKKRGMFAVLYKRPAEESASWRDYKIRPKIAPDAEITSLAELKKILILKH